MSSSLFYNSGRQIFDGGRIKTPRESERSGAATARSSEKQAEKIKRYSIEVRDGNLRISEAPKKVR